MFVDGLIKPLNSYLYFKFFELLGLKFKLVEFGI